MKFYINTSTDAAFNLALEELLGSTADTFTVMLWQNANAVIIGRNQNAIQEINSSFVKENNIQVVKRLTGGGAVYHDMGNINYTIIRQGKYLANEDFAPNAKFIIDALNKLGVPAEFSGRNDILAYGKKISGSARSYINNNTLFHGTLLFDANMDILSNALACDPAKMVSKGIKSVRSRVGNLKELSFPNLSTKEFLPIFAKSIKESFKDVEELAIPQDLIIQAEKLANERYRTWEWNFGSNWKYDVENSKRFNAGRVSVFYSVENNKISSVVFKGDFFGSQNVEILQQQLIGTPFNFDAIAQKLNDINLNLYIENISPNELAELFG